MYPFAEFGIPNYDRRKKKKWFAFNRIQLFCVWRCDDANGIIYSVAHSVGIARARESEKEMGRRAVH